MGRTTSDELSPPEGLEVSTVALGGDEYRVFSFRIPEWNLPDCLSEAERDVARALLQGASHGEIACQRGTSVRTVANQIAMIFSKLGVQSRLELAHALGTHAPSEKDG